MSPRFALVLAYGQVSLLLGLTRGADLLNGGVLLLWLVTHFLMLAVECEWIKFPPRGAPSHRRLREREETR